MSRTDRVALWGVKGRQLLAARHAAAMTSAGLAIAAVIESLVEATGVHGARSFGYHLALAGFALCATVPLGALLGPVAAAVAVTAGNVGTFALFHRDITVGGSIAELIVVYRLARLGPPRVATKVLAMSLALPFVVASLAGPAPDSSEHALLTLLLAVAAPAAAWAAIARRAGAEASLQSAARADIAGTLLEHSARGERARIARELHDVVAHHISMVAVQAETARLATPDMPAAGAERLRAIGNTARTALTEMRRLLGVLREDVDSVPPARRPQPGLSQLNELLDEARLASGSAARLILRGRTLPIDPVVQTAAYRIAQEALTNARRHAPGAAVDVELTYREDRLELRIRDNGPGPAAVAGGGGVPDGLGGHGLAGMGERAAAVGGELWTGPAPGGGFLVTATLPTRAEDER